MRVLSLGAGVQSTTVALMIAHGEIPPIDCAIFADTQWESRRVYDHLDWLSSGNMLPFPIHRVTAGNLRQDVLDRRNTLGGRFAAVPWHTLNPDGSEGMGRRQCTSEYKLTPIMHKLRDLLGVGRHDRIPPASVEVLIGISTDEAVRMKPAKQQWQLNSWPLIERRVSRAGCYDWLEARDYPVVRPADATPTCPTWPPKSSCLGCPFHDDEQWASIQEIPDEWEDTTFVDEQMRLGDSRGMRAVEFMHRDRIPLADVDLSISARARRAKRVGQGDLFGNECEGMCGL